VRQRAAATSGGQGGWVLEGRGSGQLLPAVGRGRGFSRAGAAGSCCQKPRDAQPGAPAGPETRRLQLYAPGAGSRGLKQQEQAQQLLLGSCRHSPGAHLMGVRLRASHENSQSLLNCRVESVQRDSAGLSGST
jgi:hypothetical protein